MKFENKTGRGNSLMEQCLKEKRIKSDVTLNSKEGRELCGRLNGVRKKWSIWET